MTKTNFIKAVKYLRDVAIGTSVLVFVAFAIHTATYSY